MTTQHTDRSGTIEAGSVSRAALSVPESRQFHAVADGELEQFSRFQRPLPLAVAAIFAGVFFGTAYQAHSAIEAVRSGTGAIDFGDLAYVIGNAMAFGVALTAAAVAIRGKAEIVKALKAIRDRGQIGLPPGHPAGPPAGR